MSRAPRRPRAAALTFTALAALGLSTVAAGSAQAASVATWDRVAQCESTGDWSYYKAGWPYYGGLQITKSTWEAYGGTQYAPMPHQATKQQQILTAERILAGQGAGAWAVKCNGGLSTDHANPYPSPTAPVSKAGDLFHATRLVDGNWTSFSPLDGYAGSAFFNGSQDAIAATPDGSTQTLATGADGNLYHTARYPNGSWTGWAPLDGYAGSARFAARAEAIAGMPNGDTQVMATGSDGKIYHSARYASGAWQDWNVVDGYGGAAGFQSGSFAITGMPNGDAQLIAVGNDGVVYHNARYASGSWQGWWSTSFGGQKVAVAGLPDGSAQMVVSRS
ncbi:transglycosylase family protein [Kitasatospora sp. NPDC098663]|uniref:transglycosylase family protein n=1 Tax=Kitasatospora sp. NPDC098663 TaxID=3364096 RepID=UPI00380AA7D0